MITITGLTERQRSIMDMLWTMDSMDSVQLFIRSLPTLRDQVDAQSLIQIAVEETLEQEGRLDAYADAAKRAIARARG